MSSVPEYPWVTIALAAILVGDALISIRPPKFVVDCLEGVGFPRDWWWVLVVVKLAAGVGLIVGLSVSGVAATTTAAVVLYFVCAAVAHLRARFVGVSFWVNCLGMLVLSVLVLALTVV